MLETLTQYGDTGIVLLRVVVGVIFLYHGLAKWKMPRLHGPMATIVLILKYVEPVVGALLVAGLYSELASLIVVVLMLGAIGAKMTTMKIPFSSMKATGWEFDLILLVSAFVLLTVGAGAPLF